jgi:hypothetical protein
VDDRLDASDPDFPMAEGVRNDAVPENHSGTNFDAYRSLFTFGGDGNRSWTARPISIFLPADLANLWPNIRWGDGNREKRSNTHSTTHEYFRDWNLNEARKEVDLLDANERITTQELNAIRDPSISDVVTLATQHAHLGLTLQ